MDFWGHLFEYFHIFIFVTIFLVRISKINLSSVASVRYSNRWINRWPQRYILKYVVEVETSSLTPEVFLILHLLKEPLCLSEEIIHLASLFVTLGLVNDGVLGLLSEVLAVRYWQTLGTGNTICSSLRSFLTIWKIIVMFSYDIPSHI